MVTIFVYGAFDFHNENLHLIRIEGRKRWNPYTCA